MKAAREPSENQQLWEESHRWPLLLAHGLESRYKNEPLQAKINTHRHQGLGCIVGNVRIWHRGKRPLEHFHHHHYYYYYFTPDFDHLLNRTVRSSEGFGLAQRHNNDCSSCFHMDQQIKNATQKEYKEFKITPHRAWHFRSVPWQHTSAAPPPPLGQRQQTHLSVADSPQPDTAALHSSAQLSVVRFFRSGSLPAAVPSSFVPAQHDSDIPLAGRLFKSLLSQLEVDSNCKKVGFIHVRSSFRDNCNKWWTLRVTFFLGKKRGNHVVLVWTLYLEG